MKKKQEPRMQKMLIDTLYDALEKLHFAKVLIQGKQHVMLTIEEDTQLTRAIIDILRTIRSINDELLMDDVKIRSVWETALKPK